MKKKNKILEELYKKPVSKEEFAAIFGLNNTRSIEKYIADTNLYIQEKGFIENLIDLDKNEIIYSKSKYRFNTLLPYFIPYRVLLSYLGENICNAIFSEDFSTLQEFLADSKQIEDIDLIETRTLSKMMQKIIQIKLSLQLNYSLRIEYKKNDIIETKFINPHTLINSGGIYYLYATYHDDNINNVGKKRTFALSGIISIMAHKHSDEKLFENVKGNAWGAYEENKYVILNLKGKVASFYKREGFSTSQALTFISEEPDGSIQAKMHYSNEQDVINFIQKWMPFAQIAKQSELRDKVYKSIRKNYIDLTI